MIIAALVLGGLAFGSFVNALVWRLHMQAGGLKKSKRSKASAGRYSITKGRSMCVHCKHELAAKDLIPVISWLFLRGKCRYCSKPISWQYPVVELATSLLFVASYLFWPNSLTGLEVVHFGLWLIVLTGLVALAVYDLKWMLLPNKIIFPLYGVVAIDVLVRCVHADNILTALSQAVAAVVIGGGLFYVLFQYSKGSWIGGGDVKLGFLIGGIVYLPVQAMLVLFVASLLGTFYTVPLLLLKKASRSSRIPFGPFLIVGTIVVVLFGVRLSEWYLEWVLGVTQ